PQPVAFPEPNHQKGLPTRRPFLLVATSEAVSVPSTKRGVPHISLVFREMWETAALHGFFSKAGKRSRFVVSHISRKTSEIWGTRALWKGQRPVVERRQNPGFAVLIAGPVKCSSFRFRLPLRGRRRTSLLTQRDR